MEEITDTIETISDVTPSTNTNLLAFAGVALLSFAGGYGLVKLILRRSAKATTATTESAV